MIKIYGGMSGYFKIEAFKCDSTGKEIVGSRRICADWFPNLILDQGLERIATNDAVQARSFVRVGTGSSTPNDSQTGLDNQIATSNSLQDSQGGVEISPDRYVWNRRRVRFGEGVAAGNLSEIGVGWTSSVSDTFSRALIVDSGGSPITITVLPDELLDVTYEFRVYIPLSDFNSTIELDGILYDVVGRAREADQLLSNFWTTEGDSSGTAANTNFQGSVYDGTIGSIDDSPSGSSAARSSTNADSYIPGSLMRTRNFTWGLNDGNFASGVRSMGCKVGWGSWQFEFSAQGSGESIPKDSEKILTLSVTISWGRATI